MNYAYKTQLKSGKNSGGPRRSLGFLLRSTLWVCLNYKLSQTMLKFDYMHNTSRNFHKTNVICSKEVPVGGARSYGRTR